MMLRGLPRRSALKNFRIVDYKSLFKGCSTNGPNFSEKWMAAPQRTFEIAGVFISLPQVVTRLHSKIPRSPRYPDFFDSGTKGRPNNKTVTILNELETAIARHEYKKATKIFSDFQAQNPEWMHHWPAQKIAATMLHVHLKTGSFKVLLELYNELKTNGFKHGEGIYVTLIKCFIAMDQIEGALHYFQVQT